MAGTYSSGTDNRLYPCPQCNGSGVIPHRDTYRTCPLCHGAANVNYKTQQKYLNSQPLSTIPTKVTFVTCPECGGSKEIMDSDTGKTIDCPVCGATGEVTEEEKKKWNDKQSDV